MYSSSSANLEDLVNAAIRKRSSRESDSSPVGRERKPKVTLPESKELVDSQQHSAFMKFLGKDWQTIKTLKAGCKNMEIDEYLRWIAD